MHKSDIPVPPQPPISKERIVSALMDFNILATPAQAEQLLSYLSLLLRWNQKIDLTAITDPKEIVYRHFCESAFAASSLSILSGRLADVGSGAGFPGLPLKIFRPDLQVILIESNMKKATFLLEVIRELNLSQTKVVVGRYEEMGKELHPLDYICSRALGEFDPFLKWAASESLGEPKVVLWVGGKDGEALQRKPEWSWRRPILIPHSAQRYLLVGERKKK